MRPTAVLAHAAAQYTQAHGVRPTHVRLHPDDLPTFALDTVDGGALEAVLDPTQVPGTVQVEGPAGALVVTQKVPGDWALD